MYTLFFRRPHLIRMFCDPNGAYNKLVNWLYKMKHTAYTQHNITGSKIFDV